MSDAWTDGLDLECDATTSYEETGLKRSVFLKPGEIRKAATRLAEEGFFLEDLSVVDVAEGFLVVYHFDHFDRPGRVALRVLVPHEEPEVPSISTIFSGADWHERECHDFFGVVFTDHPNLIPLLLPDDVTEPPLVKGEGRRKRLAELMRPGTIERCTSGFEELFAPPKGEGEKGKEPGTDSPG